jgi:hypothetical protein
LANKTPKTKSLVDYNKRLKAKNIQSVKSAMELMLAQSEQINIAKLAERTGLSRSTIYRNSELRELIDRFRETSVLRKNRKVKFEKEQAVDRAAQAKLKTISEALKLERLECSRIREENKKLKEHIEYLMDKYSNVRRL